MRRQDVFVQKAAINLGLTAVKSRASLSSMDLLRNCAARFTAAV
jgi:hypothetical protein